MKNVLKKTFLYKIYTKAKYWQKMQYFDTCSPDVLPIINQAFSLTEGVQGDYYEFGLFKGYTLYYAYKCS